MELTDEEIEQQDLVDNCIGELLTSVGLDEGDADTRGRLRDAIGKSMQELFGVSPNDFYPALSAN